MPHDELTKEKISLASRKLGRAFLVSLLVFFALSIQSVFASTTDGTIDSINRYAYSENAGWLDFGTSGGNVHVNDTALTGYAYGENVGWISLNCANTSSCGTVNYAVSNDGNGNLSGYAYGENVGWIDFHPTGAGVTIDSSGVFHGSAYGENIGWITFNCANTSSCGMVNYTISTDWRPASARNAGGGSSSGGGGVAPSSGGGGSLGSNYVWPSTSPASSTSPSFEPTCSPNTNCMNNSGQNRPEDNFNRPKPSLINPDLTLNSQGEDVRILQQFLNQYGVKLATTGPGSSGNETTFFGALTRKALAAYQEAVGIVPALGYFGPITRAWLRSIGF